MKQTLCWQLSLLLALAVTVMSSDSVSAQDAPKYPSFGKIHRYDPRFDELIPKDAKLEKLAEGFEWTEGVLWVARDGGYALFSDIPRNSIFKFQDGKGISLFMKPAGYTGVKAPGAEPGSNGLAVDEEGRLILCEHGDRRVSRVEHDGGKLTLADKYEGKRLNSPNDAVFKSNGDIYFTDPPYGLRDREKDPYRELDFFGVYRISKKDGSLTLLTKEMTRPNGICFSPDEKTLYVAQSDPEAALWKSFEVYDDGTLGKSKLFYDMTDLVDKKPGLPDGMKVDEKGNLFATGPGGVHVFAPDGTLLGSIETGERTANCGWGEDGKTLFVCADMYLGRIRTNTKGLTNFRGKLPAEK